MAEAGETARVEAAAAGDGEPPLVRYAVDLFHAFGAVSDKAKSGVQSCQAVAAFIAERANMEAAYARALSKTAASAQADDWAPGFAKCWALVHETLAALGKVHTSSAAKMQSTMVAGVRAFAAQQEIQVQRLIAEGTKYRTAHANIVHSVERAKEKYDKRCAEAQEILGSMRADPPATPSSTSNGALATAPSPSSTSATGGLEESKEIVGQLLTRMSSFTKPSAERQRSKLEGCLEELLVAEKHYTQSVEYANSKQIAIEREIAENLLAFQLTEEQRIEYLKDLLDRMQKLLLRNLEVSAELVSKLREGTSDINEFVDIEDGFRKLSQGDDSDSQVLDPADNAFYQRICEVQAMSDRGHTVLRNFHSTLADLMSIEDHFVSSAQRLLRNHDAPLSSSSDLFSLSTALSQVIDEGSTMKAGWQATKEQLQHLWQVHVEFRSLLAEPVALNIATMKQEYEDARTTTHDNFSRSHMALCQDTAVYQKLKQKLDAKCRDFAQLFGTLPDMGEIDLRNLDVTQVLELVHQLSSAFSEKEKRTEARLKTLGDEVREAQQKLSDSTTALKMRSSQYIQDVDMFISVYMKNEKFRLQVEKSSLISLVKALEHMVESATRGVNAAIGAVKLVDPIKDMIEFVEAHRQPRVNKVKKISPEYVDDEALKVAIDEYCRNKSNSSPQTDDKLSSRRNDPKTSPTPLKGTSANDPTANSIVSSLDEAGDGDLLGMSDFQKQFKLDSPEQVVESYSCALYANNFPNHGRMYLTSDHLCFSGWRDTIYVVAFLDISSLEKKNSALIVPNALEVTAKGEKVFFTSFVFRDECLQRILQLKAIKMATAAALTDSVRPSIKIDNAGFNSDIQANAPTCTSEAPVAPASQPTSEVSSIAAKLTNGVSDIGTPTSAPEPITPLERVIPDKDSLLDEYELLVDEEVPFSVEFAYKTIWVESSDFFEQFLERGGETAISITSWEIMPVTYTAITKLDRFHGTRQVSYVHNKKYMVGPSSIPTMQTQRYAWDANTRLVITVTTLVSDAPYCDYFRAETRWVFSNTAREGVCQLQVGISIQWIKSTWLKKQIENTALSEAKDYTRSVVDAAIAEAKKHAQAIPPSLYRATSIQPSLAPQPKPLTVEESDIVTPQIKSAKTAVNSASHALSAASAATPISGPTDNIKSLLQVANVLCVVLFFFMMYRIGSALDQMQLIARETLEHQRQQQDLFREILLKLHSQGR